MRKSESQRALQFGSCAEIVSGGPAEPESCGPNRARSSYAEQSGVVADSVQQGMFAIAACSVCSLSHTACLKSCSLNGKGVDK